ncbi:hypothetical protein PR202_gb21297 [Eleusine coracana subsp. coracana]|uniref:HVA22-like protein n=1 Tax=Eleusine coracana subsp. coracana TaxID=191504 RepID=A0AAV5FCV5_ELECO|nr:hypothetical protein PR202_gb21297 [Eleusine coracana subsp. coracana]
MALLAPAISGEVGLRLLLAPLSSSIVVRTASCAVGIGLPVYSTFRAIEKKDEKEKERLLLYWAAYGSFSIVEVFADKFLSSFYLSWLHSSLVTSALHFIAVTSAFQHCSSLLSCEICNPCVAAVPFEWSVFYSFQGSKHVYRRYIRPFFRKHQAKIDRFLNILSKELTKFVSSHEDEIRFIENMAIRGATTANYIVNGMDEPGQSEVTIEGPNSTATEEAAVSETET